MSDSVINALIIAAGVGIGVAILLPQFIRARRRAISRIFGRELIRDGATYSFDLRKGEGIWRPGKNGLVYGPAKGTYTREDRPDGVLYHLELVPEEGSVVQFTGPMAPSYVDGSEAQARLRKIRKWVPLMAIIPLVLRLGCVLLGFVIASLISDRWDLPTWISFLVAIAAYTVLDRAVFRGLAAVQNVWRGGAGPR
jgi:hypothetical protein